MHNLIETNKLLESKVAQLQVELDKANSTSKKLNTGSQVLDEVLASQKMMILERGGLGYEVRYSSKSKVEGKIAFVKTNEKQNFLAKDKTMTRIKLNWRQQCVQTTHSYRFEESNRRER